MTFSLGGAGREVLKSDENIDCTTGKNAHVNWQREKPYVLI